MPKRFSKYGRDSLDIYNDPIRAEFQPKSIANGFLDDLIGVAAPIVGGIVGGPVGAGIGNLVGGLVGGGQKIGGQKEAARAAQFRPFNIRSGSFGDIRFGGGGATIGGAGPGRASFLMSQGAGLLNRASAGTDDITNRAYGLLSSLAAPTEREQFLGLESRLLNQGRLGLDVGGRGNPAMRAFFDASNRADLARQLQAIGLGQQQQELDLTTGLGLLGGGLDIQGVLNDLLKTGLLGGHFGATAGANAGQFLSGIGQSRADRTAALTRGIGDIAGGLFGGPDIGDFSPGIGGLPGFGGVGAFPY